MTETAHIYPRVTLKLATSLDGRIATHTGASQWITSPQSRAKVHEMRAAHDCVLTGIGTVLADDPLLTARTSPPVSKQPLRVVLDSHLRTPASSKLLNTAAESPVCLFHDKSHIPQPAHAGVRPFGVTAHADGLDLTEVLTILRRDLGVASIIIEAGSQVAGSFLRAGLVDRVVWFRAPMILGGDGLSVFGPLGVDDLSQAFIWTRQTITAVGPDLMETYVVKQGL
jgi:diaminohydroxyphosphoribosylaminopyrimidine deaminase / 5-amino-6-(5-phosphoribosylamino)uracil reductase